MSLKKHSIKIKEYLINKDVFCIQGKNKNILYMGQTKLT